MEHINKIVAWEVLFIAVFASLLVISAVDEHGISAITGNVVLSSPTQEQVLTQIEEGLPGLSFITDFEDVSTCLIVNMDATKSYSYEIVKIGDAIAVTTSNQKLCKGTNNEDFIISYVSYEKLVNHLDNPQPLSTLKDEANGGSFYIYPSKYIAPGFTVVDAAEFKTKFGTFLQNLPQDEVNTFLNPSSAQEREASSLTSYLFYFIIGIVAVVLVIGGFIFTHAKKPEVKQDLEIVSYIKSLLAQGYEEEQIKQSLIEAGWTEDKLQEAFNQASADVVRPENFS